MTQTPPHRKAETPPVPADSTLTPAPPAAPKKTIHADRTAPAAPNKED